MKDYRHIYIIDKKMKIKFNYLTKILSILIMCIGFNDIAQCQDTIQSKVIELPQECKLVLDTNIDLNDPLSIDIINGIRNIIPRLQSLIPIDSIAIELAISSTNVLPLFGLGGRTNMDDFGITIEYYFDPENPNFNLELLINGLVHECHHASRLGLPGWPLTLLELMVREGLADHFMVEVTNCEQPEWSRALSEEDIKEYMILVKPVLRIEHESWNTEFNEKYFFPWMFGRDGDNQIPYWTGYSIGWKIVENYLKDHTEASASSLVFTTAEEIASSTPELIVDNKK